MECFSAERLKKEYMAADVALMQVVRELKESGLDGAGIINNSKFRRADDNHRQLWNEVWRRVESCK